MNYKIISGYDHEHVMDEDCFSSAVYWIEERLKDWAREMHAPYVPPIWKEENGVFTAYSFGYEEEKSPTPKAITFIVEAEDADI